MVVTGFHDELVNAAIAARTGGPKVRTVFNPFYKVADNLGSLFIAREELAGDCLVWNGDTLVSNALMARVLGNNRAGICVTIDRKDAYDDDDMKVIVGEDGRLRAIGKRISDGVNGELIGLLAFRLGGAEAFREAIERAMRTPEGTTIWYLRVIHHLAQNGEWGRSTSRARNGAKSTSRRMSKRRGSWSRGGTASRVPPRLRRKAVCRDPSGSS